MQSTFRELQSSKDRPLVPRPAEVKWSGRRGHEADDDANANVGVISASMLFLEVPNIRV